MHPQNRVVFQVQRSDQVSVINLHSPVRKLVVLVVEREVLDLVVAEEDSVAIGVVKEVDSVNI